ncbi:hemerythrin domain-containing protein [Phaeobacter inhibens]|uniref:hemerythrin domain-containing protein n=1 Tax=Phaeobacter inhibens TaxID=221822 RepID=UPI000F4982EE|nr:hemerythrin domain-containing protein [Phaeobacter inhibens]UWR84005.1 hemerythrin domain-containing protein [Phaeobacter inhibens]
MADGKIIQKAAKMLLDYDLPEYHVSKRKALPSSVKETLLESTRSEWEDHPRFGGKASFFMSIHRNLLDGAAQLSRGIERLLDVPASDVGEAVTQMNLLPFAKNLIGFAHHHHEIEDHGYFPQFGLMYPELNRGLSLLDGDHKVLDAALDDTQAALTQLNDPVVTRDQLACLHKGGQALENILNRHIWDEEEVIIPIFLRHG